MIGTWIKRSFAMLVILAPVAAVLLLAGSSYPVRDGYSAAFWKHACGVDLGGQAKDLMGGVYPPRDGWYIYYVQGLHSQILYRLPRRLAVADFGEVVRTIKARANEKDPPTKLMLATAVLEQDRPPPELTAEQFLSLLHAERLKSLRNKGKSAYDYAISEDQAFEERWARTRRYWANICFECVYFSGLSLFALWPWLRAKRSAWSWSLHLGSLPLLLMLPFYCGYAPWTFTSAGPGGGVLYPWVISWFRGFPVWTSADQWVLQNFPKVLEPLSQILGPWHVISGTGTLGPVIAVALGAVVGVSVFVGFRCLAGKVKWGGSRVLPEIPPLRR